MQQDCLKRPCTAARLHGVTYFRRQQFLDAPQTQPSLGIDMAHVCCSATIYSDVPNNYGWCLVSSYYTHWCTEYLWLMFGVQLLYTVMYRTLMAHVWCPATIHIDVPNSMAHVWCPATIHSDLSNTYGLCLVSSYCTQWCTEHLWLMFGVQLLYTVMYRKLMADVWCPATMHSDLPNTQWPTLKDLRLRTWLRDYHIIKPHYHL